MTLITPPNDRPFTPEKIPEPITKGQEAFWRYRRTMLYLNCANWKCVCGCVVFGRCITCPYCTHVLGKTSHRPKEWRVHE